MAKPITDKDLHAAIDRAHDLWLSQYDGDLPEHTFSADFEAKAAAIPQKKAHRRHPLRTTIAVAAIVAALTMTIGADVVADPIFFSRGAISGISQVLPKSTDWVVTSSWDHEGETWRPVFKWLPEGLTETYHKELTNLTHLSYLNDKGQKLTIFTRRISKGASPSISLDTEGAEVSTIRINGKQATLVTEDDSTMILYFIKNYDCHIISTLPTEDVIKIAKNMELK